MAFPRWQPPLLALMAATLAGCAPPEPPPQPRGLFVVVHIPEGLIPLERAARYEEPLGQALEARGLGEVSGGGSQMSPPRPDGTHEIISIDIDVDLADAAHGLPALREELHKLHPPPGTQLAYTGADGSPVQEAF
ncbi:MAG TPA: hypothetical protein VM146_14460 [Steroidobacteraceae bacterium]|nr:hypothetical protein [Steroidobacteraceae bacterium]